MRTLKKAQIQVKNQNYIKAYHNKSTEEQCNLPNLSKRIPNANHNQTVFIKSNIAVVWINKQKIWSRDQSHLPQQSIKKQKYQVYAQSDMQHEDETSQNKSNSILNMLTERRNVHPLRIHSLESNQQGKNSIYRRPQKCMIIKPLSLQSETEKPHRSVRAIKKQKIKLKMKTQENGDREMWHRKYSERVKHRRCTIKVDDLPQLYPEIPKTNNSPNDLGPW